MDHSTCSFCSVMLQCLMCNELNDNINHNNSNNNDENNNNNNNNIMTEKH